MNIQMIGIDYHKADISKREPLSFTQNQVINLLPKLANGHNVLSCALLATCNRTELYLHTKENIDALELLSNAANLNKNDYLDCTVSRYNYDAIRHLMEVSSGLQSQIFGDDQIVTQVKNAMQLARNAKTLDNVLETLFRRAVTAGKRVKTETRFYTVPPSAAAKSVQMAKDFFGDLSGKKAVVIGNGEMGRLAASLLAEQNCDVTITLRTYRHGQTIVPAKCKTHSYDDRYTLIDGVDLVCSATTSPHCTITYEKLTTLNKLPKLFIDLAMPRDIDSQISKISNITVWNLDNLGSLNDENQEDIQRANEILEKEISDFYAWNNYRSALPVISQIKDDITKRVYFDKQYDDFKQDNDLDSLIKLSVNKAVDLLLAGMKDTINQDKLSQCLEHIRKGL